MKIERDSLKIKWVSMGLYALLVVLLSACSAERLIPENEYMLDKVELRSATKELNTADLAYFVRQKSNSRWFSFFKIPLGTYALAGSDSTKWLNRTLKKVGEKPVLYDTLQARLSCEDLCRAMQHLGYMNAAVRLETKVKGKKLKAIYHLNPGEPFRIKKMAYEIEDTLLRKVLGGWLEEEEGMEGQHRFTVADLDSKRKRVTVLLNDSGYYRFNKDYITFSADSVRGSKEIDLTMRVENYRRSNSEEAVSHPRYVIHKVNIIPGDSTGISLRQSVIDDNNLIEQGKFFSASDLQKTYNRFARLGAVRYTNIEFKEYQLPPNFMSLRPKGSEGEELHYLDADITISNNKPHTISFQPEGTNTAGDLGVAGALAYQNRNLFKGSELFSLELRAAFEAITGLEGYENRNYEEYSVQSKIEFPRFLAPFVTKAFRRRSNANSEVSASWAFQNRPEFHRRVFSGAWRYRWANPKKHMRFDLDALDLSYVYMPWISSTFKANYLDNVSSRNVILRYNYEDLFIMKMGFGVSYAYNDLAIKAHVESAGNMLSTLDQLLKFKKNEEGQNTFFNIAYAQYLKFDFDFTKMISFDEHNSLVVHTDFGIAYPYGNSKVLPFEKRYIAGGANSVRGWSVRELGPGKFRGSDGRIDFINQTGDVKFDFNLEYRTHLFWKFDGAAFFDVGNIWTLREYADQPSGQFRFGNFIKQLAAAYGLGLRLNFDYFILRLDAAMKAINPVYENSREHFPIFHPSLKRDFKLHFAVGLPF